MLKAAKGGQFSRVNGENYAGGQFMPETGEYCGLGKNRVFAAEVVKVNATLTGARIAWYAPANVFQLWATCTFANGLVCEQVRYTSPNLKTVAKFAKMWAAS